MVILSSEHMDKINKLGLIICVEVTKPILYHALKSVSFLCFSEFVSNAVYFVSCLIIALFDIILGS